MLTVKKEDQGNNDNKQINGNDNDHTYHRNNDKLRSNITKGYHSNGPSSSVGIATDYRPDGSGIESRWKRDFTYCPDRPWGLPSLLYNGYRISPGGRKRPGRDADPSPPLLVPRSKKQSRAITLLSLRVFVAYKKGETYPPTIATLITTDRSNTNNHLP
jgi:hypothetical protein